MRKEQEFWRRKIIRVSLYVGYAAISAFGLLLVRIFVGPYLGEFFSLVPLVAGSQSSLILFITIVSLPSAALAGAFFGLVLGLWEDCHAGRKLYLVSICVVCNSFVLALVTLGFENIETHGFHWLSLSVEALIFIVVFVLSAIGISHYTLKFDIVVKKIASVLLLVGFFAVFVEIFKPH